MKRYALQLVGLHSSNRTVVSFMSFHRRADAEAWAQDRGNSLTRWEVVDQGPFWRRALQQIRTGEHP